MLSWLPKSAVVAALACSIGLHWAFWQAVAWTGMVASYSRELPISQALSNTFDGKHPCQLCKHIAESKRAEKKSPPSVDLKKLEFRYSPSTFVFSAAMPSDGTRPANDTVLRLTHAPPVPPPRLQLA